MTPSQPKETALAKSQRQRAQAENVRSIQDSVSDRTKLYRKILSPRASLITGAISTRLPL